MRCAVFARHQGQVHQVTTAEHCAYGQAGRAPFFGVHIGLGDADAFVHGQIGLSDDQSRHQFGQGCNRQNHMVILAVEDFLRLLVHHQGDAGVQAQRVGSGMQARHLAKRCANRARVWPGFQIFSVQGRFGRLPFLT